VSVYASSVPLGLPLQWRGSVTAVILLGCPRQLIMVVMTAFAMGVTAARAASAMANHHYHHHHRRR